MHNAFPRMSGTPGEIRWPGGAFASNTDEFCRQQFGLSEEQVKALHEKGVI
jgi:formyl-CoA transferase